MSHIKGSCVCGEVQYMLNSEIMNVVNCHCNFCRSHSGAAFTTYAVLPHRSLEITTGKESLTGVKLGEGRKHFCNKCGTPVFNLNKKYPGLCMIYFGTLENSRDIKPMVNVWYENKLGWIDAVSSIQSVSQDLKRRNT